MKAELILAGGRVRTLGRRRVESHLAASGGLVLAVGDEQVMGLAGPGTRVIRLAGATVLPGFNDPHAHVVYHALSSFGADLTGVRSIPVLQQRMRAVAEKLPPGQWCLGRGYSEEELGRAPTRFELDAAVGSRPAFVDHRGGHSRVANTAALAAAGLTAQSPDPSGGSIGRESGELTGLLSEAAMRLVADRQPPPSFALRKEAVRKTLRLLASRGITSVGAAVNRGFADDHRVFSVLAEEGRLPVRVNEFLSWELLPALAEIGLGSGGGSLVRFGPLKVFVDGGAASGTAAFRGRQPAWRTPPAELAEIVRRAHSGGLQVAAHCIGDAAIEAMADAVAAAQKALPEGRSGVHQPTSDQAERRLRHRVEHCTYCPADLRGRLASLGMVAVMQPLFAAGGRARLAAAIGERGSEADLAAHAALLRAGVVVAFSSDLPVVPEPSPWLGMAAARSDQPDPVTALQALRAYTIAGAYCSGEESVKGSLEPGRWADFQVYDADPAALAPSEWPALRPRLVAVAGRPVWESLG